MTEKHTKPPERSKYRQNELMSMSPDLLDIVMKDSMLKNVITSGAILDNRLQQILSFTFLLINEGKNKRTIKEADILFDPNRNGPLVSIMNKARLAYILGIIDKTIFNDLKYLSRIRNIFAHEYEKKGFGDSEVMAYCSKLSNAKGQKCKDGDKCYELYTEARKRCYDYFMDVFNTKKRELIEKYNLSR